MTDSAADTQAGENATEEELVFEREFEASLDKVWRALTVPELREQWLPHPDLAETHRCAHPNRREVQFRLRDPEPPNFQSLVRVDIKPNDAGGTHVTIVHRPLAVRTKSTRTAANSNTSCLLRAA